MFYIMYLELLATVCLNNKKNINIGIRLLNYNSSLEILAKINNLCDKCRSCSICNK